MEKINEIKFKMIKDRIKKFKVDNADRKIVISIIVFLFIFALPIENIGNVKGANPYPEELYPNDLQQFFKQYDIDNSNSLDWTEAKEFYNWVEANIIYRYDDEKEKNPLPYTLVGDGRDGAEYWQKPYETYKEKAGDCEDMAILELAFYNYWGISAYMGVVDVDGDGQVDHAICIVLLNEKAKEEIEKEQDISYYTIDGEFYLMVDNAYSNTFGNIDSKTDEDFLLGNFKLYDTYTLIALNDKVWKIDEKTNGLNIIEIILITIGVILIIAICIALATIISKNRMKEKIQNQYYQQPNYQQQMSQYPYQNQQIQGQQLQYPQNQQINQQPSQSYQNQNIQPQPQTSNYPYQNQENYQQQSQSSSQSENSQFYQYSLQYTNQSQRTQTEIQCPNCGNKNNRYSVFCTYCGYRIRNL